MSSRYHPAFSMGPRPGNLSRESNLFFREARSRAHPLGLAPPLLQGRLTAKAPEPCSAALCGRLAPCPALFGTIGVCVLSPSSLFGVIILPACEYCQYLYPRYAFQGHTAHQKGALCPNTRRWEQICSFCHAGPTPESLKADHDYGPDPQ